MNNTAKLVKAFVQCSGITDAREISARTGVAVATIYRALNDIKLSALMDGNIPMGENENIPMDGNETCSPSRAPELFEENNNPIVPKNSRKHGTNPRANGTNPRAKRKQPRLVEPERFDAFWEVYPLKKGKGQARNAWAKAVSKVDSAQVIVDAATKQAPELRKQGKYCKHPSTWLNAECWEDGVESTRNGKPFNPYSLKDNMPTDFVTSYVD